MQKHTFPALERFPALKDHPPIEDINVWAGPLSCGKGYTAISHINAYLQTVDYAKTPYPSVLCCGGIFARGRVPPSVEEDLLRGVPGVRAHAFATPEDVLGLNPVCLWFDDALPIQQEPAKILAAVVMRAQSRGIKIKVFACAYAPSLSFITFPASEMGHALITSLLTR